MNLPFTADQFFDMFASYNHAFWLIVVVLWITTLGSLVLAWRAPARRSGTLTFMLAALWTWSAVAYHAWLFARINRAAWLFALLFAIEGVVLINAGLRRRLEYFSAPGWTRGIGTILAAYALLYPLLSMGVGRSYPATPTFGVPCPTALLTIGLLLTATGGTTISLTIVPILWAFIGGSAAFLLGVPTDYVLLASGVLLVVVLALPITPTLAPRTYAGVRSGRQPADHLPS
jgi:uncharacterized protein DUF6064